jgi:hypothetical protein
LGNAALGWRAYIVKRRRIELNPENCWE